MKVPMIIQNQRGAALIAGLLILVILSILGITTMQSSVLQERMAGNLEQRDVAFQAAEAGLRDAEAWLQNPALPGFTNNNGLYRPPDGTLWSGGNAWWSTAANRRVYVGGDLGGAAYPLPLYYLEYMMDVDISGSDSLKFTAAPEDTPGMYRITSRGESPNGRSVVILQSTFIR